MLPVISLMETVGEAMFTSTKKNKNSTYCFEMVQIIQYDNYVALQSAGQPKPSLSLPQCVVVSNLHNKILATYIQYPM